MQNSIILILDFLELVLYNYYINVYMLDLVERIDYDNKVSVLAKSNRKPLDRVFMIESDKDIKYVSEIIKDYMELLFIK